MSDSAALDVDAQARALLAERGTPRRRARPRLARPLQDAEEITVSLNGGEVAAWRLGTGPAVLLVHGWEDDNALWGPLIERFAQWGRPVVALDLPGHGFSSLEDASIGAVSAAVREVAAQAGPVFAAVGHSYGCAALIHALGHGLSLERVVLVATPVPRTQPRRPLEIEGVDPTVLARAEELRQAHAAGQTEKIEQSIQVMTTPALVVHSIDDEQTPLANAQRLTGLWPDAELMLTDGLGHRFVAQDDDVLERVVGFVEGA